tara:strand:+ start:64 stop:606 length:543 start_codon:yes stop_codon:yes gene_type:complete
MKNHIKIGLTLLGVVISLIGFAQDFSAVCKKEMSQFGFLTGEWVGEGWVITPQGSRENSMVTESIAYDLNNTVISLRGTGTAERNGDKTRVHDALGVLYYDPFTKKVNMDSWIARGMSTKADLELLGEGKMKWWFPAGPNRVIRYTINIENDKWNEVGEMSSDKGETWVQFFEMNLTKQN